MLNFQGVKVNGYFNEIMIGPLLCPPKSSFICFSYSKDRFTKYNLKRKKNKTKTKTSFNFGLLWSPCSMPLFQPLTLPPIFQALFFLHNLSQELSCLCPHLSLVWGTVCLFLWLASMKLYYSLVLRDHRIFCSSTVLFNVHASQPTCKKESSWFLSYLKNKRLINELPYFNGMVPAKLLTHRELSVFLGSYND